MANVLNHLVFAKFQTVVSVDSITVDKVGTYHALVCKHCGCKPNPNHFPADELAVRVTDEFGQHAENGVIRNQGGKVYRQGCVGAAKSFTPCAVV